MQQITPSRMLSVGEAADFLRISKSWLNKRRCLGGPDVQGEQGSGKSGTSRLLRALLDPNCVPIRALPHSERDLMIAATNGHVLAFDNISTLPPWLPDALCRLSTGGGLATRRNYTDREEELFNVVRPVILNGIEHFVSSQ